MIFKIVENPNNRQGLILVPLYQPDANGAYEMLNQAFPYTFESHDSRYCLWDFSIVCFGQYDNAIEFFN